jgi:ABC-2 type transport system permease protein
MRTAGVVFRRELGAFFDSPIAYVVAIGFLLLNSGLFMLDFWSTGEASLRSFFEWVGWSSCFIVPAITMRSWADERRGSTFELLVTMPTSTAWIVVGKFLASLAFFAFCLLGSFVLPVSVKLLATKGMSPDWGAMAAGYLGCLVTGALLIAVGMFLSGLCRDQIEAYIVTLLCVLVLRFFGFPPIASQIDAVIPGAGSFLLELVSFSTPMERFLRGLVGLGDVLFYVIWITGFLLLNALFVEESRLKPGARVRKLGAALLGIPVIALAGSLALELKPRLDLTADRLFTVSDAAAHLLESIPEKEPVQVKLYFSPKDEMPAAMTTLERDVTERLEALQRRAHGRMKIEVVHLHADEAILKAQQLLKEQLAGKKDEETKDAKPEEKLLQEGVVPFPVRSGGLTGTETKVVYAAMTITHGAKPKEVIPQLMPGQLGSIEQELLTRTWRLVKDQKPVVALLAPIEQANIDPQQMQLLAQLGMPLDQLQREQDDYRTIPAILSQGQQYEVRRLRPDQPQPIGDDVTTLIVIQPGQLSERMKWEIERFVNRGGSLVVAAQTFQYGLRPTRSGGAAVELKPEQPGLDPLLADWGLSVPQKMVLNEKSFPLSYDRGPFAPPGSIDFRWAFPLDASNFNHDSALANGLGGTIVIQSSAPVEKDDAKLKSLGLAFTPILSTGEHAWTRDVPTTEIPEDLNDVQPFTGPIPLVALVRGQFPAPAATPPAWPQQPAEGEPAPAPVTAKPGSVLVVGSALPFMDGQIAAPDGLTWSGGLLKNAVDALSLGDELLRLTVRDAQPRPIKDVDRGTRLAYEVAMIGLGPALIAVLGIVRLVARKRRQEQPFVPSAGAAA